MIYNIPAKTFFLGEYAVLKGFPSIVLATTPCFRVAQCPVTDDFPFHEDSPAGRWWQQQTNPQSSLSWFDPYNGKGGLGASTAQFIGAYMASANLTQMQVSPRVLWNDYRTCAKSQHGLLPSGHDVLAQLHWGCVHIDPHQQDYRAVSWPFDDIGFILVHTGKKLATHIHLQDIQLPEQLDDLGRLVQEGRDAFDVGDSEKIVRIVNSYHANLELRHLVAPHSLQLIAALQANPAVLAIKGCGAMGADVLLLLVSKGEKHKLLSMLHKEAWDILATEETLLPLKGYEINLKTV